MFVQLLERRNQMTAGKLRGRSDARVARESWSRVSGSPRGTRAASGIILNRLGDAAIPFTAFSAHVDIAPYTLSPLDADAHYTHPDPLLLAGPSVWCH